MAIQLLNVNPIIDLADLPEFTETYDIQWIIPEWRDIRSQEKLVTGQKIFFETGGHSSNFSQACQTKWTVGFNVFPGGYRECDKASVQWQLLDITKKSADQLLEATLSTQLWGNSGLENYTEVITKDLLIVGDPLGENLNSVDIDSGYGCPEDDDYIQEDGSIKYQLKLVLKSCLKDEHYVAYKMERFLKKSNQQMCENLTSLLNQRDVSSDLKIVTQDDIEIFVHGSILKAQCPVFAGMLHCDLSETNTGIVRVTDVSAKTMNILLNYFYTEELLPSWREEDTIVEFTYAAGKYQITTVLELLDDVLGRSVPDGGATNVDVQLVNLASKLAMPNAEGRLLERIVDKINKVKGSQEIFDLFGYNKEEVLEMAEVLGGERFGETKALKVLDDLIGNSEGNKEELEKRGMHLLAIVHIKKGDLKNLEKNLLKRFAKAASKTSSADKLFAVFGHGKGGN